MAESKDGKKPANTGVADDPTLLQQMSPAQHEMMRIWCAMLHRMGWAVGGTIAVKVEGIPDDLAFDYRVVDGVAYFTAITKQQPTHPAIVRAAAGALDKLPKMPSHMNGRG